MKERGCPHTSWHRVRQKAVRCLLFGLVPTLAACCLVGCWDREELDRLALVVAVGVDQADEPGKVRLTAQIVKPAKVKTPESGGGSGGEEQPVWIPTGTGKTVFEALRSFAALSPRRLYWAHNCAIVLGREAAEAGVRPLLDFFLREHEARQTVHVLVAQGRASEVLEVKPSLEAIAAREICDIIGNQTIASEIATAQLQEFAEGLMSTARGPVAPVIAVVPKEGGKRVHLSGTAVFRDDKLVGELDSLESRGLLWVLGKVKSGVIDVELPAGNGLAGLEIISATSKIMPSLHNGTLKMTVRVWEEGNLGNEMAGAGPMDAEMMTFLNTKQAEAIRAEIWSAINKARIFGVDIFGLGDAVHRRFPEQWKTLQSSWSEVFQTVDLEIVVETKLRQTGLITRPAAPK